MYMKARDIEAINKLNNILPNLPVYNNAIREIKDNVQILVQGINELDQEVKQKTFEVKNREQLLAQRDNLLVQKESVINQKTAEVQNTKQVLAQKEQKLGEFTKTEFADSLHKLYPDTYSTKPSEWFYKDGRGPLPMKVHYDTNNIQVMEKNINFYKERLTEKEQEDIKKKFISSLHELYPNAYSANFEEWTDNLPMKKHVVNNNFYVMVKNTATYQKEIEEINAKKLEDAKRFKEEEEARKEQVLIDNHKEIEDLKALIAQKELETQESLAQQEIEKQELLARKEAELHDKLHDKSLVKNQVIGELHGALNSQEKEAYKLQIELLTKQLAFKEKESELKDKALELKDKALEDARVISELKGQLLTLKALYGHDISFSEQFSAIQFRAESSIANNDFDDIAELSRYISRLVEAEKENSVSLDISELLNNLSPISPINSAQHPVAVVNNGNFDINNQHITHSVLLNGEGSESFEII